LESSVEGIKSSDRERAMKASRTHHSRQIQYHAENLTFNGFEALQSQIITLLNRRKNPMSLKQIQQWFRATDPQFVARVLMMMDEVKCFRNTMGRAKANCAYYYELEKTTDGK
jgi:hypothetical protein